MLELILELMCMFSGGANRVLTLCISNFNLILLA